MLVAVAPRTHNKHGALFSAHSAALPARKMERGEGGGGTQEGGQPLLISCFRTGSCIIKTLQPAVSLIFTDRSEGEGAFFILSSFLSLSLFMLLTLALSVSLSPSRSLSFKKGTLAMSGKLVRLGHSLLGGHLVWVLLIGVLGEKQGDGKPQWITILHDTFEKIPGMIGELTSSHKFRTIFAHSRFACFEHIRLKAVLSCLLIKLLPVRTQFD